MMSDLLTVWVDSITPRGDGLDEVRARAADHAAAGLLLALGGPFGGCPVPGVAGGSATTEETGVM
jgi:hypothetical protein